MKTSYLSFIAITLLIFLSSCNNEEHNPIPIPKTGDNFNFYKSGKMYQEGLKSGGKNFSAPFEIDKVTRDNETLTVTVSYSNQCSTNKFDIIWDGAIRESWPMQTDLLIKRTTSDCSDKKGDFTEIITIDLKQYFENDLEHVVFHIYNASKERGDKDAWKDVTTSN